MKQLLVFGEKTFKIEIPDDAKVTFGPWSPPRQAERSAFGGQYHPQGTLRIYQGSKENIVALFCGVYGFRDLSLAYQEQIAVEEGASLWKDDQEGYVREDKRSRTTEWVDGTALLPPPPKRTRRKAS